MLHLKNITLLLAILLPLSLFSQSDFKSGYYINNNNDTIYGLIDNRGEIKNSKNCSYKEHIDSKSVTTFRPGEIKSYKFDNGKYYISESITIDNEEKLLFLEYLVNGIADLFFYKDIEGDNYLIKVQDGNLIPLTIEERKMYVEGKGEVVASLNKHVGVLKATFADCPEIQPLINNTTLDHKSLIKITKKYHENMCDTEECIVYEKKESSFKVKFGAEFGYKFTSMKFTQSSFYSSFDFENSNSPTMSILIDFPIGRIGHKYFVQTSLSWSENDFTATQEPSIQVLRRYEIYIHTTNIQPALSFKYVYPKGKIRPTIALGAAIDFIINNGSYMDISSSYSSSTSYNLPIPKNIVSGMFQIGYNYQASDNIALFNNFCYQFGAGNYTDTEAVNTQINTFKISFGLYF